MARCIMMELSIEMDSQMPTELQELIDAARLREFSASEREEQRRSFAYGNTKIENPRITRATIDRQAELLTARITVAR
jgi:hypothetical protein